MVNSSGRANEKMTDFGSVGAEIPPLQQEVNRRLSCGHLGNEKPPLASPCRVRFSKNGLLELEFEIC